jgi:hypothetical protein
MLGSTFISLGFHTFLIFLAYFGLPSLKVKEPIEQPIDIVEETPVSSKTSLKLGSVKEKKEKKIKKEMVKKVRVKKAPPPPPLPSKKIIEKKNAELKKKKKIRKVAELIKKKPKTIKKKQTVLPTVVSKPEKIKKKQKIKLAKGILKTLSKPQLNLKQSKKEIKNINNKEVLDKLKKMVGNSNRQVQQTQIILSQTEIDKIKNHVRKFWKVSYGASEVKIIITLQISTNTDGTIKNVNIFDKSLYQKDKFYRATADAARRAVFDSSPLPLPKGKEKKFKSFVFDFDTSFINSY